MKKRPGSLQTIFFFPRAILLTAFFMTFCLISFLPCALATEQMMESLIYKGERIGLDNTPLEDYFDAQHPRPNFPPECTGEWKGYHGVWELKDGALYLVKVQQACPQENDPDVYSAEIFKGQKLPIKAVWVSGLLRAAYGEKTLQLDFDKGVLTGEEVLDQPIFSGSGYGAPPPEWDIPPATETP